MKKLQGLRNLSDGRMVVSYEGFKYMEDKLKRLDVLDEWVRGGVELVLDIEEKDFTNDLMDCYWSRILTSYDIKEYVGDDLEDYIFGVFDFQVLPLGEYANEWRDKIANVLKVS